MTTWCSYCDAEATHVAEETKEPLCTCCATAYKAGQLSPDTSVAPISGFKVVEHVTELRQLTYYVNAISDQQARKLVEDGLVSPKHNKSATRLGSFKTMEIKSVERL